MPRALSGHKWFYYLRRDGPTDRSCAAAGSTGRAGAGVGPGRRRRAPGAEPQGWTSALAHRPQAGAGRASPVPLPDALQLLGDGAEAGPLRGLVGPALLHEPEHGVGAQLGAGQAAPCGDRHGGAAAAVRSGQGTGSPWGAPGARGAACAEGCSRGATPQGPRGRRGPDPGPTARSGLRRPDCRRRDAGSPPALALTG